MIQKEQIKAYAFDRLNNNFKELKAAKASERINKSFTFTVKQLNDGDLKEKLKKSECDGWPAVYCFFDTKGEVQYIGKAIREVWNRLGEHVKGPEKKDKIKENWTILLLYSKLWVYDHEVIEKQLTEKMTPPLNKQNS